MSKIEVDAIVPQSGTNLTVGESGDTITVPSGATFDASNATTTLPANVVTTDGTQTLTNKTINASQLTGTITPSDGTVTNAKIVDSTIELAKLSATGTKNATTFLRGDNTFASAGGENTPAFSVYPSAATSLSDVTNTKIAFNTEILDTDNAFNTSTNRFTVPSGKGGYYQINLKAVFEELGGEFSQVVLMIYKNGSNISEDNIYSGNLGAGFATTERWSRSISRIVYLNDGDYVEGFAYINETSGNAGEVSATQFLTTFDGYRLIGV